MAASSTSSNEGGGGASGWLPLIGPYQFGMDDNTTILDYLASIGDFTNEGIFNAATAGKGINTNIIDPKKFKGLDTSTANALAAYFTKLSAKKLSNKLTPQEAADMLAIELSLSGASGYQDIKTKYGSGAAQLSSTIGNNKLNLITSMNDIPRPGENETISQVTMPSTMSIPGSHPKAKISQEYEPKIYRVYNTKTKAVKYYYLFQKATTTNIKYQDIADSLTPPYVPPFVPAAKIPPTRTTLKPKSPKIVPFYSPDYKTVYEEEIKRLSIMLLNTAESVLSNFNYATIDSIPEYSPDIIRDENNEIVYVNTLIPAAPEMSWSPQTAEQGYLAQNNVFASIRNGIDSTRNTNYVNAMQYFGYKKTGETEIVKYLPSMDGQVPRYSLQIEIPEDSFLSEFDVFCYEEED